MSEPETPTTDNPAPAPANLFREAFSQANITTGLAVFAVILAAAPYVVPQVQAWQVRSGLMRQPAILQEASVKLSQEQEAAELRKTTEALAAHKASLFADAADPILGNPAAKIRIVEFLDYNCGYCRAGSPLLKTFLAENPDVAIIVKEYPVINKNSPVLAAYALAAAGTGKYEALHYAFMNGHIASEPEMFDTLRSVGLDPEAMKARASSDEIQQHISRVVKLGEDLNVTGTPTFIIGDTPINGARIDDLKAAVEKARKGA